MNSHEIIVDSFAGGGGASTGIELALGRSPDIAINHDATALAMHQVNHPETAHLTADIWSVDPREATGGQPVGLLWASPDCKHFSKAKGGKPVEKSIRSLAWVVVHWANLVSPRVIILENVEEFSTWGPLGDDGRPCPLQKGKTFERWVGELTRLGYAVEWRELRACDYGAPTIRKRLFLIARRDGAPIVWPKPSHGDPKSDAVKSGRLKPWRTAAEIIDWSLPCPSIFDSSAEIMAKYGLRAVRPLQPATMARIAKGVKRYVLDAAKPFIVNLTHHGAGQTQDPAGPLATVTAAHRGEKAVVTPFVTGVGGRMGQSEPRGADQPAQTFTAKADSVVVTPFVSAAQQGGSVRETTDPLHTVTASRKDQNQIIVPTLIQTGYGEREGQEPRVPGLDKPLGTTVACGVKHALVAPHLTKFHGGQVGASLEDPAPTVTSNGFIKRPGGAAPIGVVAPHLMTMRNSDKPHQGADQPAHTITAGGAHATIVAAALVKNNFGDKPHYAADEPVKTIVAGGNHHALLAAHLTQHNTERTGEPKAGRPVDAPLATVLQSDSHASLVAAFMAQHNYLEPGHDAREPVSTIVGKGSTQGLAAVNLLRQFGTGVGSSVGEPARTVMADGQGKTQLSAAFLQKYYGSDQDPQLEEPLHTATTKDRFGLVTVEIEDEPYVITDIGMRMLTPRELFRAQGFPDSYVIDRKPDGSAISKTEQVSKCGNSVCPPIAAALVNANFAPDEVLPKLLEAAE